MNIEAHKIESHRWTTDASFPAFTTPEYRHRPEGKFDQTAKYLHEKSLAENARMLKHERPVLNMHPRWC